MTLLQYVLQSSRCLDVITVVCRDVVSAQNFTDGLIRETVYRPHIEKWRLRYNHRGSIVRLERKDRIGKEQGYQMRSYDEAENESRIWGDWANLHEVALKVTWIARTTIIMEPKDEEMYSGPHHDWCARQAAIREARHMQSGPPLTGRSAERSGDLWEGSRLRRDDVNSEEYFRDFRQSTSRREGLSDRRHRHPHPYLRARRTHPCRDHLTSHRPTCDDNSAVHKRDNLRRERISESQAPAQADIHTYHEYPAYRQPTAPRLDSHASEQVNHCYERPEVPQQEAHDGGDLMPPAYSGSGYVPKEHPNERDPLVQHMDRVAELWEASGEDWRSIRYRSPSPMPRKEARDF